LSDGEVINVARVVRVDTMDLSLDKPVRVVLDAGEEHTLYVTEEDGRAVVNEMMLLSESTVKALDALRLLGEGARGIRRDGDTTPSGS